MPIDQFIEQARGLRSQGCGSSEIRKALKQYGATADEADRVLKMLQNEERGGFDPRGF
ncbi:MAG: hypothetical protein ACFB0C_09890 [Leptolyngbyaceae cyanobacterium]